MKFDEGLEVRERGRRGYETRGLNVIKVYYKSV